MKTGTSNQWVQAAELALYKGLEVLYHSHWRNFGGHFCIYVLSSLYTLCEVQQLQ
jgi:hypothetical protein